jgi:hypothetical protein
MSLRVYYEVLNQKGSPALYTDTLANRPAFGFQGRLFFSTDTAQIYEDTGSAWTLIADATGSVIGFVPYSGATNNLDLGFFNLTNGNTYITGGVSTQSGILAIKHNATGSSTGASGYTSLFISGERTLGMSFGVTGDTRLAKFFAGSLSANADVTYTLPNASGTLALLEGTQTFSGSKTFTQNLSLDGNGSNAGTLLLKNNTISPVAIGYASINSNGNNINLTAFVSATKTASLDVSGISDNIPRTFTFPNASGTLALTSDLSGYVTLATTQTISGAKTFSALSNFDNVIRLKQNLGSYTTDAGYTTLFSTTGTGIYSFGFYNGVGVVNFLDFSTSNGYRYTFPNATGTVALTSDLSGYVTLATTQTISGAKTFSSNVTLANASPFIQFYSADLLTNYGNLFVNSSFFQFTAGGTADFLFKNNAGNNLFGITQSGVASFYYALNGTTGTFSGILTTPQVKAYTSAGLSINANSGTQVADFGAGGSANITFYGGLSGTSASFSGSVTAGGEIGISGNASFVLNAVSGVSSQQLQYRNNGTNKWQIYLDTTSNSLRFFNSTNSSDRVTLLENGNVLIGTTTDDTVNKLQVNGSGTFTSLNEQLSLIYSGATRTTFRCDSAGGLLINTASSYIINYIAGVERFRIKTNTINISSIPTSSAGLSSGDIYSNLGILTIVP